MPRDVELGAHHLFDVDSDSDSADEEPVHFGLSLGIPMAVGGPFSFGIGVSWIRQDVAYFLTGF